MKTNAITFRLMISLLLLAITTSNVAGENEAVVDFYGKPVQANAPYYAGFVTTPAFITRYRLRDPGSCPEGAVLSFEPTLVPRIPVIFESSSDVVRVDTKLSIKFALPNHCVESGVWRVTDKLSDNDEVLLTGSKSSNDSTFTITKSHRLYKFAFNGAEVGVYKESFHVWRLKLRRLVLNKNLDDMEFEVAFYPAKD